MSTPEPPPYTITPAILSLVAEIAGRVRRGEVHVTTPGGPPSDTRPSPPGRDREGAGQPAHDVFVSYSTNDKPVADAIVSRLEQAGIRCWVAPRDIIPGQVCPAACASA